MKPNKMRPWDSFDDHRLKMMAKAGWSVQMAAAQLNRLPYDAETRAEVLCVNLSDRTAGKTESKHDPVGTAAGKAADAVATSQLSEMPGSVLP